MNNHDLWLFLARLLLKLECMDVWQELPGLLEAAMPSGSKSPMAASHQGYRGFDHASTSLL